MGVFSWFLASTEGGGGKKLSIKRSLSLVMQVLEVVAGEEEVRQRKELNGRRKLAVV